MLLVSGGPECAFVAGACGLGPPQAARSKTTASTDHGLIRMGKH
jgi:hypothetical protein